MCPCRVLSSGQQRSKGTMSLVDGCVTKKDQVNTSPCVGHARGTAKSQNLIGVQLV